MSARTRCRPWPADTLAWRFATTIALAVAVAVAMTATFVALLGDWARPPLRDTLLLERADDIVRMAEAVPAQERPAMTGALAHGEFIVTSYPAGTAVAEALGAATTFRTALSSSDFQFRTAAGQPRRVRFFKIGDIVPALAELDVGGDEHPETRFLAVELAGGDWIVFTTLNQLWGLDKPARVAIGLTFLVMSICLVSAVATHQMSRPILRFTAALHRFGTNPRASPIAETGPRELRQAIGAFNAMQSQVQRFVEERTTMLAAISHDLRTPLTRIRLRSELIEDDGQRAQLCRDVDEMQAMVGAALSFFGDNGKLEEGTVLSFPELLRTIADEYCDLGKQVTYDGPDHAVFFGRPFALKRAFTNVVDNAVKYGGCCEIELRYGTAEAAVVVRDRGPGIPVNAVERVFAPFFRLEQSRNKATGGIGLGLTSARAVISDHGGRVALRNRPEGGLEVSIVLPRI